MRHHSIPRGRALRRAAGATITAALAVTLAACSNSGSTSSTHSKHNAAAPAAAASTPASAAAAATSSGLSGTWHGQYGGAYTGTFVLHWHQSGSHLSGRIHISNPSRALPIHGTLSGSSIRFGTVGSQAITYTGTVSGGSMSGNWGLGPTGQGGTWNASKG